MLFEDDLGSNMLIEMLEFVVQCSSEIYIFNLFSQMILVFLTVVVAVSK